MGTARCLACLFTTFGFGRVVLGSDEAYTAL